MNTANPTGNVIPFGLRGWCARLQSGRAHYFLLNNGRTISACEFVSNTAAYIAVGSNPSFLKKARCSHCERALERVKRKACG